MSATVGLRNLHYAIITADSEEETAYGTMARIGGMIQADIEVETADNTLYADNIAWEAAVATGKATVSLNLAEIPIEQLASLLGHTLANGEMLSKSTDEPPYVGLAFEYTKNNGKKRFVKLMKGKFKEPNESTKTKEGNSVEFQTPTLEGTFIARLSDGAWKKTADEEATGYTSTIGDSWYTAM